MDDDDNYVPLYMRTQAFKYRSNLIHVGTFNIVGLNVQCPVSIEVKCFVK